MSDFNITNSVIALIAALIVGVWSVLYNNHQKKIIRKLTKELEEKAGGV